MNVTFFDSEEKLVKMRYYGSVFLGHSTAEDLLRAIIAEIGKLNWTRNLISVGMDGPNVNWSLLKKLKVQKLESDPNCPKLLEIGSCGLHIIHGAFRSGQKATGWDLNGFL